MAGTEAGARPHPSASMRTACDGPASAAIRTDCRHVHPCYRSGVDPTTRRWWLLLDQLPDKLGPVTVWRDSSALPAGDGHMHANPTAVVCLTGVVRVSRPGRKIDLKPGEALLIAPGIWHRHEPLRPGSVWFGLGYLSAWSDVMLGDDQREWHGKLPAEP